MYREFIYLLASSLHSPLSRSLPSPTTILLCWIKRVFNVNVANESWKLTEANRLYFIQFSSWLYLRSYTLGLPIIVASHDVIETGVWSVLMLASILCQMYWIPSDFQVWTNSYLKSTRARVDFATHSSVCGTRETNKNGKKRKKKKRAILTYIWIREHNARVK